MRHETACPKLTRVGGVRYRSRLDTLRSLPLFPLEANLINTHNDGLEAS